MYIPKKWTWLLETAKAAPFLLKPEYRRQVEAGAHPLTGHCYVVSEVAFHFLGGRESDWVPETISLVGGTHWYLRHKKSGDILDLTEEQFGEVYHRGRRRAFLTVEPSKRAVMMAWLGHHYFDGPEITLGVPE